MKARKKPGCADFLSVAAGLFAVLTEGAKGMKGAIAKAQELAAETSKKIRYFDAALFFCRQEFCREGKKFNTAEYEFAIRETKTGEVVKDVSTSKSEIGIR